MTKKIVYLNYSGREVNNLDFIKELLNKELVKSILFLAGVGVFLYLTRSILNLFLLTFLFAYLINSLENTVINYLKKYIPIKKGVVTAILYICIIVIFVVTIYNYLPVMISQTISTIRQAEGYYMDITKNDIPRGLGKYLVPVIEKINMKNYTQSGVDVAVKTATNVGKASINVFIALILSLFFIMEKEKVVDFLKRFENSKISGIYKYCEHFGGNFLNSFGKVIKAQVVIAIVNTTISVLCLGLLGFNKLFALGFMIFFLSLIPVAGVIISLVPLSLIAFKIGGIMKVIYVLIMILVIHCIESYFLNPKLMSQSTKLPIFFTFVVLIVSEHFMGIWGLLLGIPLFMFLLDILGVDLKAMEYRKIFNKGKKSDNKEGN